MRVCARGRPIVRTHNPTCTFCWANTCSTRARTTDLRTLARATCRGIGRPGGFLRWFRKTQPMLASQASLACEGYAVSPPQTLAARLSLMTRQGPNARLFARHHGVRPTYDRFTSDAERCGAAGHLRIAAAGEFTVFGRFRTFRAAAWLLAPSTKVQARLVFDMGRRVQQRVTDPEYLADDLRVR